MLTIEGLYKSFDEFVVIRDVSFELKDGETHAIIGPNGAGKTTLFHLITGHVHADRGNVVFHGAPIVNMAPHRIVRLGLARSFQQINIFPRMTVMQNVQVALIARDEKMFSWFSLSSRVQNKETRELLDMIGLADEASQVAAELAYGKQKQLELAIALATNPKLLLLDEPTAGMSSGETKAAVRLIQQIKVARDLTVLFTEHDMSVVFDIADRVSVLDHGQVIATGTPEEIRRHSDVRRVYLGSSDHGAA